MKTGLKILSIAAVVWSVSVSARAQWTGTANNSTYENQANWKNGIVNDDFTGEFSSIYNGPYLPLPSSPGWNNASGLTFAAGGTTVSTGANANAWNYLAPGQTITGTGIPAGTVITAITGSNSFTISAPATDASSGNYNFAALNNAFTINISDYTLAGNFTYRNLGTAYVTFLQAAAGTTTWSFASANPVITVDMGVNNISRNLQFGIKTQNNLAFDFKGGDVVFNVTPAAAGDGDDKVVLFATINNAASLTKTGYGYLDVYRPVNVSGHLTLTGTTLGKGAIILNNGSDSTNNGWQARINAAALDVVGQRKSVNLRALSFNDNMLDPSMSVYLYAGALNLNAQGATAVNQVVGSVNIYGRALLSNSSNQDDATLTLSSLERKNFATLNLIGNGQSGRNLGDKSYIKIASNDAYLQAALVGGQGAAGSTNISIIPWITAQTNNATDAIEARNSGAWAGSDFVTYTTAGGFRALTASEYKTFIGTGTTLALAQQIGAFAANDNLHLVVTGTGGSGNSNFFNNVYWTLNGNQTVNAIKFGLNETNNYGSAHTLTLTAGQTLTVTSGAIIVGSGNTLNLNGGILNTGANPLITAGRAGFNISSVITNNITNPTQAGVIAANVDNFLTLSGSNTYGGMTVVQTGLKTTGSYALPSTTRLQIDRDGDTRLESRNIVAELGGVGKLSLNNNGSLRVGAGGYVTDTRTIAIGAGGVLAPGDLSGDYQAGTLLLGGYWANNNGYDVFGLKFETGSIFAVDLTASASDQILLGNLTNPAKLEILGGTLSLNFLDGFTPDEGATWLLTQGFTTTAGLATNMTVSDLAHPDWEYTLTFDNNNLKLTLDTIPEPSTWLLLATGAGLLACLRRRR